MIIGIVGFIGTGKDTIADYIWAQGPTYDINILEHAYKSYN